MLKKYRYFKLKLTKINNNTNYFVSMNYGVRFKVPTLGKNTYVFYCNPFVKYCCTKLYKNVTPRCYLNLGLGLKKKFGIWNSITSYISTFSVYNINRCVY